MSNPHRRYYLAGPMSGLPDLNFPAFADHAAHYRGRGLDIASPHEIESAPDMPYEWCIRRAVEMLMGCDAIILLPGWEASRGAVLEEHLARMLAMPSYTVGAGYELAARRLEPTSVAVS